VSSAERVLVVLSGPPDEFSRKGIESARQWLEQEADTVEVLVGDDPRERSSQLAAAVLLSNVSGAPRIETLQDQAVDAQERIATQQAEREEKINDLITDENDDLDPVV
jgi:cell division GTPase FtsZ